MAGANPPTTPSPGQATHLEAYFVQTAPQLNGQETTIVEMTSPAVVDQIGVSAGSQAGTLQLPKGMYGVQVVLEYRATATLPAGDLRETCWWHEQVSAPAETLWCPPPAPTRARAVR